MKIYSLLLVAILVACAADKKPAPAAATVRRVELSVTENGFEPTPVKVSEPLELVVTRKTDKTCATDIVVKDHDIKKALPLNEPVVVAFTPSKTGELRYGCAMDQMVAGVLLVE
jgi:plastocyanin domain-containing protein